MRRMVKMFWMLLLMTGCNVNQSVAPTPPTSPSIQPTPLLPTRISATLQPKTQGRGASTKPQPVAGAESFIEPSALPKSSTEHANLPAFPTPKAGSEKYAELCGSAVYDEKAADKIRVNIAQEVQCLFEAFYQARTLESGKAIDLAVSRQLVDGAYTDYTMPLLSNDVAKAAKGELLEVHYTDISTKILEDQGNDRYIVQVTRTRVNVTSAGTERISATLKFHVVRVWLGGLTSGWYIDDFLNPSTNTWVSGKSTP